VASWRISLALIPVALLSAALDGREAADAAVRLLFASLLVLAARGISKLSQPRMGGWRCARRSTGPRSG
jgi:hypothetical protein